MPPLVATPQLNQNPFAEIGSTFLSSCFDPCPVSPRLADEAGVAAVRRACLRHDGALHRLRVPLNRNAYLVGCLDFTEHEPREHLIIGFGYRRGSTTRIDALLHLTGTETAVAISPAAHAAIGQFFHSDHRAEVLLFHNHPKNWLNIAFDNDPLASAADRQTLAAYLLQPAHILKSITGGGRIRFYLGENGFVREFVTPSLLNLVAPPPPGHHV
ncbi:MAG TPA: hypothetical protein VG838_06920 [Opitutaceae bacterium]|nr:hypothetical protein [Lacunisphaera sp.]HWA09163.1 hypothetical protein [Opitutaceae bacterium]